MKSARHCPGAFKKAKHDLKKLKVLPMSAIGIGFLRRVRSSGPTRPIEYSGSNRKNAVWILKRLPESPMVGKPILARLRESFCRLLSRQHPRFAFADAVARYVRS